MGAVALQRKGGTSCDHCAQAVPTEEHRCRAAADGAPSCKDGAPAQVTLRGWGPQRHGMIRSHHANRANQRSAPRRGSDAGPASAVGDRHGGTWCPHQVALTSEGIPDGPAAQQCALGIVKRVYRLLIQHGAPVKMNGRLLLQLSQPVQIHRSCSSGGRDPDMMLRPATDTDHAGPFDMDAVESGEALDNMHDECQPPLLAASTLQSGGDARCGGPCVGCGVRMVLVSWSGAASIVVVVRSDGCGPPAQCRSYAVRRRSEDENTILVRLLALNLERAIAMGLSMAPGAATGAHHPGAPVDAPVADPG